MKQYIWRVLRVALGVIAALVFAGCGGGGVSSADTLPPLPTFIAGSVTEPDRTRVITEVTDFYRTIANQPDAVQRVITFMTTKPEFATAEKSKSGDAIGWFKDGVMYAVAAPVQQRPGSGRDDTMAPVPPVQDLDTRSLPGANKAYLIDVSQTRLFSIIPTVDPELTFKGYDTIVLEGAIGDFAQIQNAGVLYLQTLTFASRDRSEDERTWYMTTTPNTEGNRALYQEQIDAGTIAACTVGVYSVKGQELPVQRLLVSDEFLEQSGMSFSSRGIWINDVEYGAQPQMVEAAFRIDGLLSYWAWSGGFYQQDADETARFVFARFLGIALDKSGDFPPFKETEVQGAISTTARFLGSGNMNRSGADSRSRFAGYGATDDLTMIPSIRGVALDLAKNRLEIEGLFGSESGAITIDGSTLNLIEWTPTKVTVEAPSATSGAIVLRSLGGASASGQLLSNRYEWEALALEISPTQIVLKKRESKSFSVSATTGTVPPGSTYTWTLGGAGTINGTTTVTGSATSVTFRAPNVDGVTILKVEVFTPSGSSLGEAYARIEVGDNRISYEATGVTTYPKLNGEFTFGDGVGFVFNTPSFDEYEFGYNWDNVNSYPRVLILLTVPANTVLAPGQEYSWQPGVGVGYSFGTTQSLTEPTLDGNILLYGTQGSLTILSATRNSNGTQTIGYAFIVEGGTSQVVAGGSGTIVVMPTDP